MAFNRREFLRATGASIGALYAVGSVRGAAQEQTFTLGTWGGVWEQAFKERLVPAFEDEFGVRVVFDISSTTERVAKIRASQENQQLDFAMLTPEGLITAIDAGLTEPIDTGIAGNVDDVFPNFRAPFDNDGEHHGAAISWSASGLLWRRDLVPFEINEFTDLWHLMLRDKITVQNMPTLGAATFLISAAITHGGSQENLEPGWQAMQALKPNIDSFFDLSSETINRLVQGDIWATQSIAGQALGLEDQGVAITIPREGTTYSMQGMGIPVNTKNYELANEFMNFVLRPEMQTAWAEVTQVAPTTESTELPPDIQSQLVETPEVADNLIDIDFRLMSNNLNQWAERWLREIAS